MEYDLIIQQPNVHYFASIWPNHLFREVTMSKGYQLEDDVYCQEDVNEMDT